MEGLVAFVLGNFTLTFLVLGFVAAAISISAKDGWNSQSLVVEEVLAYFLFFSVGISFFYNFVFHVFFGEMAARFIGWADSPFQAEVGYASLGFAIVGFLGFRGNFEARLAAIIGPACFLLGAAWGHLVQMVVARNFAPGNAGVIFYTDILIPVLGAILLRLRRRRRNSSASQKARRRATPS